MAKNDIVGYWRHRSDLLYYQYVYLICRVVGAEARSVLDVGSRGTPFLEWLDWIDDRVSIDYDVPYESADVKGLKVNLFDYDPGRRFDLTTCLQVMEHVPEAGPFGERLLQLSRHLIVSVPYKWGGKVSGHVHDPVSLAKLDGWMGRPPNHYFIVEEPFISYNSKRLIAYYDVDDPSRRVGITERRARRPNAFVFTAAKQPVPSQ